MKKFILSILLISQISALDSISALPKEQREVVQTITDTLKLPPSEKIKNMIYDKLSYYFETDWYAHWITNRSGTDSKIENSNTQICDVSITNDNRVANITFIYFKKERQLFISVKQYVEGKSKAILELYSKRKKDSKYKLLGEDEHFACFNQKGYMTYETYHVKAPVGMIVYEDSYILNIDE